jgi:hypothetical protein
MSIMPQPLPSRCAAMPRMAPMVTTPVPADAIDENSERLVADRFGIFGSGRAGQSPSAICVGAIFFGFAPCTVTKDGQKPLTQEKSLLQLDWSIVRLRPNSVSSGCTETQFDLTPQSPQPSQTEFVDEDALVGIHEACPALAAAALLGGAGLVVDQDRRTRRVAQLAHGFDQLARAAAPRPRAPGR